MKNKYHCIIIGGGPAGATAAYCLAREGVKVVLLEASKLPRDKLCGGLISRRAINQLPFNCNLYLESIKAKGGIKSIEYYKPNGKVESFYWQDEVGYILPRKHFDYMILEQAANKGCAVLDNTRAVRVGRGEGLWQVTAGNRTFSGKYLIGAYGTCSNLTHTVKCGCASRLIGGWVLTAEIKGAGDNLRDTCRFFSIPVPTGMGWCFPCKGGVNFGIGAWYAFKRQLKNYYPLFSTRIAEITGLKEVLDVRPKEAFLPIAGLKPCIACMGLLLVGDAAGLVEPFSGEGIFSAIYSGKTAARAILEKEGCGMDSPEDFYTREISCNLLKDYRYSILLSFFRNKLGDRYLGARTLGQIMRGEVHYGSILQRLLMTVPFAV